MTTLSSTTLEAIRTLASPGRAWRELSLEPRGSRVSNLRQTVGAVISHVLGHRPRVWPYLGE